MKRGKIALLYFPSGEVRFSSVASVSSSINTFIGEYSGNLEYPGEQIRRAEKPVRATREATNESYVTYHSPTN